MLVRAPSPSGACCVGLWPPSWWGVLCWCVAPLLLGRAVSVPACCGCAVWFGLSSSVGRVVVAVVLLAWPGLVLCWCMPPPPLGRAGFVRGPPPWWGVLCWRVRVSVRGAVAGWMPGLFRWFAVVSPAVRPALSGVGCLWCLPGRGWCCVGACPPPPCWGVPCLCVPPPLVGRAVSACPGFGSWCCSRLDARLVLLVCCCLRLSTAGVVGCWWFVVFSWPERTGQPPQRVWCATPLLWRGQTGQPPERVRCANPFFCFAGVVALPLLFPCTLLSVRFLALRWCLSPPAAVPPPPHHPALPLAVFCPPLCLWVWRARRRLCPPHLQVGGEKPKLSDVFASRGAPQLRKCTRHWHKWDSAWSKH